MLAAGPGYLGRPLRCMVITEGALAGRLPPLLYAAAGTAAAAGVLVTRAAALLPAHLLRRLPAAQLLAQE